MDFYCESNAKKIDTIIGEHQSEAIKNRITNRKKISDEYLNLCEAQISIDEIIKSINNKSPVNYGLTA